jgi:hypothetical protein
MKYLLMLCILEKQPSNKTFNRFSVLKFFNYLGGSSAIDHDMETGFICLIESLLMVLRTHLTFGLNHWDYNYFKYFRVDYL